MSDDLNNPNDPLDELLAQARWTEPQRASTERLTESWRQLRRPRYAILPALTAAAAVIAIALVSWHWVTQSKPSAVPQLVERPVEKPVSLPLVGRPMTALETTLYEAQMRKLNRKPRIAATVLARSASRTVIVKRIEPPPAPAAPSVVSTPIASVEQHPLDVDAFLARVADPKTRAQALATLDVLTNPPTDQLMTYLTDHRSDIRVAAALALGRIDGPATTDRLIALIAQGQSRREAFIALAASRGDEARAFLQQAAQSENLGGLVRSTLALSELQHSEVQ